MIRPVKTYTHISTHFGDSPDPGVFGKHAGTDYACSVGTPVYAPVSGKVTASYLGSTGNIIEVTANGKSHRMLHLSSRAVSVGALVTEGQAIGKSGIGGTGPHLHWDVRVAGTAWDASFSNYFDPESLLTKEDVMTPDDVRLMINAVNHMQATDADIKAWTGLPATKYAAEALTGEHWKTQNEIVLNAYPKASKQITDIKKILA